MGDGQCIEGKIIALEREADIIKRDLRLHLPTGLFLPVARTDLLELLSAQDKIANKAEDIANLIVGRKMVIPDSLAKDIMVFLACCVSSAELACKAINELDQLLETGFRGSELKVVEDMIVTLDDIEQNSDEKLKEIRQRIFEVECDLPAIEGMFLYN